MSLWPVHGPASSFMLFHWSTGDSKALRCVAMHQKWGERRSLLGKYTCLILLGVYFLLAKRENGMGKCSVFCQFSCLSIVSHKKHCSFSWSIKFAVCTLWMCTFFSPIHALCMCAHVCVIQNDSWIQCEPSSVNKATSKIPTHWIYSILVRSYIGQYTCKISLLYLWCKKCATEFVIHKNTISCGKYLHKGTRKFYIKEFSVRISSLWAKMQWFLRFSVIYSVVEQVEDGWHVVHHKSVLRQKEAAAEAVPPATMESML